MVVLIPVPVVVTAPGVLVKVHVPVAGKLLKTTSPVAIVQVGCVMAPTAGVDGVAGSALIITLAEAPDIHPEVLVTVKVNVPGVIPEIVVLVPVPVVVKLPGVLVNVHEPAGNPFKITDPEGTAHEGCVIVPTDGADGVTGCALITILAEATEVHPEALLTVKVYVPAANPVMVVFVPVPVVVTAPGVLVKVHVPDAGSPFKTTFPVETAQVG